MRQQLMGDLKDSDLYAVESLIWYLHTMKKQSVLFEIEPGDSHTGSLYNTLLTHN